MTMTPYRILSLTGLLLITACNGGAAPIDSKSYLNELDGPKVKGVSDALAQAATAAEQQGNFRVAAQNYEQMLEKKPGDKDLMLSLADSLRRDGQSARAVTVYDALLAADPKNIAAKEGKGLALIASGDFDSPAALFDEVMAADPTRWKTLNALGILFTTRNMQPEAQQYFKEALKYHASSPSIMNNLGLSQALERNFDGAIGTLSQASATAQPGTLERKRIDLNTALVLASAGKLDDARMLAEQYLAGAELDNNLGLYAHLAKDDQMARAYLNKALSDSKVYYAKAWDNLEEINKTSTTPDKKTDKKDSLKAMLKKLGTGLFVTELMGQGVNYVTGDYSRGAAGYWVENGVIQYPVQEITIAGHLGEMFQQIVAVGADAYTYGSKTIGSVLIEKMKIAGQGN
ncbi:MAG: hypothetical protein EBV03_07495 [Proteobacteria bacterium]|nr:hypothetical protein [Pseudomonadota bacterium]